MIGLNNSTSEILHYKKRIKDKINHAFLAKYIQQPSIDEDKLFVLTKLIPLHGSLSEKDRDAHIMTTMLVQVALDTHELVPAENNPDETREHLLKKQLRVLAGDYYSGLYYYLLAQTNDYKFINTLAISIKKINEYKMSLYYQEYESYQEYLDLKVHIESILIFSAIEGTELDRITEVLKEWLYIKHLVKVRDELDQTTNPLFFKWLSNYNDDPYLTYEAKLNHLLNEKMQRFEDTIGELAEEATDVNLYFKNKLEQFNQLITSSVKEG